MIERPRSKRKRKYRLLSKKYDFIKAIVIVIIIAAILRVFVLSPFRVNDAAMQNSLYSGDFLLAYKLAYKTGGPKPGDLVVFEHPFRGGERFVRRVMATEGQTVEIAAKKVFVNGEPYSEVGPVRHSDYRILPREFSSRDYTPSQQVPPGHIFVLGDNRDQSDDSRDFGFVATSAIDGKGLFVYFSWIPDPNAPKMEPPYIIPALQILFYHLYSIPTRVRWDRLFVSA